MTGTSDVCQFLPWDSDLFGVRIARVNGPCLDQERVEKVRAYVAANRIDCLYYLVDAADRSSSRLAEDVGFRCVDIRVTFELKIKSATSYGEQELQPVAAENLADVMEIARESFLQSRFYADPHFRREDCDRLYEAWLNRSLRNETGVVLAAHHAQRAVGFITCERSVEGQGVIGLIGVSEAVRGAGFGGKLVDAGLAWFAAEGCNEVRVVTQGVNIAAQRLYQAKGFRTRAVECWYHGWHL